MYTLTAPRTKTRTKSLGLTVRFVLEVEEAEARRLLDTLPGLIRIAGIEFASDDLRIGTDEVEVEPARAWIKWDEVPAEKEDDFLNQE